MVSPQTCVHPIQRAATATLHACMHAAGSDNDARPASRPANTTHWARGCWMVPVPGSPQAGPHLLEAAELLLDDEPALALLARLPRAELDGRPVAQPVPRHRLGVCGRNDLQRMHAARQCGPPAAATPACAPLTAASQGHGASARRVNRARTLNCSDSRSRRYRDSHT